MATYVIADIHGHKDELDEMLAKISFCDEDELYILGDILDKGPKSAEMLLWATEEAGENIHFLMGNHEDMAKVVLERDPEGLCCFRYEDVWRYNGASETLDQIEEKTSPKWRRDVLIPWMESLKPYTFVNVGGKDFALVHAGFNPYMYEGVDDKISFLAFMGIDANDDPKALKETYDLEWGLGKQYSQDLMWIRSPWIFSSKPAPIETVFGHSYIKSEAAGYMEEKGIRGCSGGSGKISHILNRHGIDCGCAYASDGEAGDDGVSQFNLACLRLEDMAEFYVPAIPYTPPQIW